MHACDGGEGKEKRSSDSAASEFNVPAAPEQHKLSLSVRGPRCSTAQARTSSRRACNQLQQGLQIFRCSSLGGSDSSKEEKKRSDRRKNAETNRAMCVYQCYCRDLSGKMSGKEGIARLSRRALVCQRAGAWRKLFATRRDAEGEEKGSSQTKGWC